MLRHHLIRPIAFSFFSFSFPLSFLFVVDSYSVGGSLVFSWKISLKPELEALSFLLVGLFASSGHRGFGLLLFLQKITEPEPLLRSLAFYNRDSLVRETVPRSSLYSHRH